MHRPMLVFRQPNLFNIDGIPVTNEERTKAELYFLEQQVSKTSFPVPARLVYPDIANIFLPLKSSFQDLTLLSHGRRLIYACFDIES